METRCIFASKVLAKNQKREKINVQTKRKRNCDNFARTNNQ